MRNLTINAVISCADSFSVEISNQKQLATEAESLCFTLPKGEQLVRIRQEYKSSCNKILSWILFVLTLPLYAVYGALSQYVNDALPDFFLLVATARVNLEDDVRLKLKCHQSQRAQRSLKISVEGAEITETVYSFCEQKLDDYFVKQVKAISSIAITLAAFESYLLFKAITAENTAGIVAIAATLAITLTACVLAICKTHRQVKRIKKHPEYALKYGTF